MQVMLYKITLTQVNVNFMQLMMHRCLARFLDETVPRLLLLLLQL
jgi:hypothetical protein